MLTIKYLYINFQNWLQKSYSFLNVFFVFNLFISYE